MALGSSVRRVARHARKSRRVTKRYSKNTRRLSHGRRPKFGGVWGAIRWGQLPARARRGPRLLRHGKKRRGGAGSGPPPPGTVRRSSSRASQPGVNFNIRAAGRGAGQLRRGGAGGALGRFRTEGQRVRSGGYRRFNLVRKAAGRFRRL